MSRFVEGYNHTHHHTGIGLNTPAAVHYGLAAGRAIERSKVLAAARAQNPARFSTRTDPKILALPGPAWINPPAQATVTEVEPKLVLQSRLWGVSAGSIMMTFRCLLMSASPA